MLQVRRVLGVPLALAPLALGILFVLACASVASAQTASPANDGNAVTPAATASSLTILGQIANGTPGGTLPVTMTVTLYAVDGQALAFTSQGTADASGKVRFDNVNYQPGRKYALAAQKGNVPYNTELAAPKDGETSLTLSLRVYDTTTDTSRLRVDEMYVVGQFLSGEKIQITNAYFVSNSGDHAVQGGERAADGQDATLRFYLPPSASDVEFQGDDGKRFLRTQDGYLTTWGVRPGMNTAQVVMRYTLPYTGQLHLETKAQYPVQKVSVLLADQGVTLTAPSLVDQGVKTGQDGVARRAYTGDGLASGQSVVFDLAGTPKLAPVGAAQSAAARPAAQPVQRADTKPDTRRLIGEGIIIAGLLAILAACVMQIIRLRRPDLSIVTEHRALFEALADLDEEHETGKIPDPDYAEQREFLKAALLAALQSPSITGEVAAEEA